MKKKKLGARYSEKKSKADMFPGIKDFIQSLHDLGFVIALNTSALSRNCVPMLEKQKILQFFDYLGTADIFKSKVEKFKLIAEKYSVSTDQMIFITDTLGDIREADIAHVPTVAVTWGAHDQSYFTREPHENLIGIVDSVDELREYVIK